MQLNLRKLWPVLGVMCMSFFTAASAHPYGSQSNSMSLSPQRSSQSMSGQQGTYQRGSYRKITPDAGPRVAHGADVYITADFIWWKAVQEGTAYATSGIGPGDLSTLISLQNTSKGTTRFVGRDWSPGFKVGLGLNMSHDGWDLYAQYTWLHPSNHSSISRTFESATFQGVTSLQAPNTNEGPYGSDMERYLYKWDRASSNWHLHFNVIDLELGRNFYLSQFLTMRPFIGLKGTWQDQHFNTRLFLESGLDFNLSANLSGPYRIRQDVDVWGIGVRGGFNISWYMSKCWSIYGDMAWTSMWADYTEINRKDTIKNADEVLNGISPTMVHMDDDSHYSVKWIGEIELGLRWEIWFYDDSYHFAIQAGWEHQVWLNWTYFQSTIQPDRWEDLNFHGLNLKFRFDF